MAFDVSAKGKDKHFTVGLPAEINCHNSLIALAVADEYGVSDEVTADALSSVFVKGRCETVRECEDITVIIDYAHNGVSLKSIIDTARDYDHNRIITLFGLFSMECR